MKKIIFMTLALALGFATTGVSEAQAAPAWTCKLSFKGTAKGLKIIVGKYEFNGTGTLGCLNANGSRLSYPVGLKMKAHPLNPGFAIGKYTLYGQSGQISLFHSSPDDLLGTYMVAQGHATIVGGVGVITAAKLGNPQLSLTLSLNFSKGAGFDLTANRLYIYRLKSQPLSNDILPEGQELEIPMEEI